MDRSMLVYNFLVIFRRTRPDGNCFFRAFGFRLFEVNFMINIDLLCQMGIFDPNLIPKVFGLRMKMSTDGRSKPERSKIIRLHIAI